MCLRPNSATDEQQEAHAPLRARLRRGAHDVDPVHPRRREALSAEDWSVLSASSTYHSDPPFRASHLASLANAQACASRRHSRTRPRRSSAGSSVSTRTSTIRTLTRSARWASRVSFRYLSSAQADGSAPEHQLPPFPAVRRRGAPCSVWPVDLKLIVVPPALGERPGAPGGLQQDHPGRDVLEVTRWRVLVITSAFAPRRLSDVAISTRPVRSRSCIRPVPIPMQRSPRPQPW